MAEQSKMQLKRQSGCYYTLNNPFDNVPFKQWAKLADLPNVNILNPLVGQTI